MDCEKEVGASGCCVIEGAVLVGSCIGEVECFLGGGECCEVWVVLV